MVLVARPCIQENRQPKGTISHNYKIIREFSVVYAASSSSLTNTKTLSMKRCQSGRFVDRDSLQNMILLIIQILKSIALESTV